MTDVDFRLDSDDEGDGVSEVENHNEDECLKVQKTTTNTAAARLRKSCELCRTQKARCIANGEAERCQRCARNGSKCVFLAAKARPKKAMSSKARVAEMEHKLDGLMAMLEAKNVTQILTPELTPNPPERKTTSPLAEALMFKDQNMVLLPQHQSSPYSQDLITPPWSTPNVDGFADVITKGYVTVEEADQYVRNFRLKTVYFPFVVVPISATLDSLRRERPFLLCVIILLGCSQSFSAKQKALEGEFLEMFAKKSIVEGEKSLDLLQGLLVYAGQYHYFFNPQKQQVYQNSQLLASMAIELGINKITDSSSATALDIFAFLTPQIFSHKLDPTDPECRRTLCGVYVVSAGISRCVRQSSNIKYSAFIGECCSFLSQASVSEHDHLIQYFVRLQQFQDEINAIFDYDGLSDLPKLDCAKIETFLAAFNTQLQQFQETFPKEIWNNTQIMLKFHYVRTYLYEIAFHADTHARSDMDVSTWSQSTTRTSALLSCLFASKAYIEHIISLPPTEFLSLTMLDFTRLIYCVLVLGCFATPNGAFSLTLSTFQELSNLQYHLDALVVKTNDILLTGRAPGYCFHFNFLFKDTDEWYASNPCGPGVKGRCITDLVGDMFPIRMKYAANDALVVQPFDAGMFGVPPSVEGLGNEFGQDQNVDLWPNLDVVLGEIWNGEGEFGGANDSLMNGGVL